MENRSPDPEVRSGELPGAKTSKTSACDRERRRRFLRSAAAGLGGLALVSEKLAFGFLVRPGVPAALAPQTTLPTGNRTVCTVTTTQSATETYTVSGETDPSFTISGTTTDCEATSFTNNVSGDTWTHTYTVSAGDHHVDRLGYDELDPDSHLRPHGDPGL